MQHFGQKVHLDVIKDCLEGNVSAQKQLFDMLAPGMMAVCIRYMGEREAAKDVLQDGFITLFSKLDEYSARGPFEGWARKIFVNTALMALRKKDMLKESTSLEDAFGVAEESPSVSENLARQQLMKMIAELPPGYRTVFNLYAIEGFSHKEIAGMTGISEATSRSQLQRARMLLQAKLKKIDER